MMRNTAQEQEAIGQISVRAMLRTSSRATTKASIDVLSDYDPIPFFDDRIWLGDFEPVLVVYRDPILLDGGLEKSAPVTQYENGLEIDCSLWPVELLQRVVADPRLPDGLDGGCRALLDKDYLTDGLKPPTYRAYIPTPPTEAEYQTMVELLFHEATYVAKFLLHGG